jgi:hypothetical protein
MAIIRNPGDLRSINTRELDDNVLLIFQVSPLTIATRPPPDGQRPCHLTHLLRSSRDEAE